MPASRKRHAGPEKGHAGQDSKRSKLGLQNMPENVLKQIFDCVRDASLAAEQPPAPELDAQEEAQAAVQADLHAIQNQEVINQQLDAAAGQMVDEEFIEDMVQQAFAGGDMVWGGAMEEVVFGRAHNEQNRKKMVREVEGKQIELRSLRRLQSVCKAWYSLVGDTVTPLSDTTRSTMASAINTLCNPLSLPKEKYISWNQKVTETVHISDDIVKSFISAGCSHGIGLANFLRHLFYREGRWVDDQLPQGHRTSVYFRPSRVPLMAQVCFEIKKKIFEDAKAYTSRRSSKWFHTALKNKGRPNFVDWWSGEPTESAIDKMTWGAYRKTWCKFHYALLNRLQYEFEDIVFLIRSKPEDPHTRNLAIALSRFIAELFNRNMITPFTLHCALTKLFNLKHTSLTVEIGYSCVLVILVFSGFRLSKVNFSVVDPFATNPVVRPQLKDYAKPTLRNTAIYERELQKSEYSRSNPVIQSALNWFRHHKIVRSRLEPRRTSYHWAVLDFAHEMSLRKIRRCMKEFTRELQSLGKKDPKYMVNLARYGLPGVVKVSPESTQLRTEMIAFERKFPQVGVLFVVLPQRRDTMTRDNAHSVLHAMGYITQEIRWQNLLYKFQKAKDSPERCFQRVATHLARSIKSVPSRIQGRIYAALGKGVCVEHFPSQNSSLKLDPVDLNGRSDLPQVVDVVESLLDDVCVEAEDTL